MYRRRVYVSLVLALIAALAFSNVAFASASRLHELHRTGKVLSVDLAAGSFKLISNIGQHDTIHVDKDTVFKGNIISLAGMKPGMSVNVHADLLNDGTKRASQVTVHKIQTNIKIHGTVTDKDDASRTFMINGHDGKMYNFHVRGSTKFSGLNGTATWSKLTTNSGVVVTYEIMANGQLDAVEVHMVK